jgi:hypothetical protein
VEASKVRGQNDSVAVADRFNVLEFCGCTENIALWTHCGGVRGVEGLIGQSSCQGNDAWEVANEAKLLDSLP